MTILTQLWQNLQQRSRWELAAGLACILFVTGLLGFWAFRTEYQVLFSNLAPQDAAVMVAELDQMKIPYRLEDGGNTILVAGDIVHKTRLKLVGKNLPLHGTVGLELFNNNDIGMTEFAQKVNYQRAQQGELTRTILSIEEVQSARVHLAIPEQGLFKKNGAQPKASITVAVKPGKSLHATQVQGIQRLVAAAIPNIKAEDVTILDQHGVALTQVVDAEGEAMHAAPHSLDGKRSIEEYLNRKVLEVLDRSFGSGQSIASVDVVLNHDHTRITTENVLPANGSESAASPAGVIVRERQTQRAAASNVNASKSGSETGNDVSMISSEVDYQVGRRVEQVVSGRGSVSRLNVAVVVKRSLDAQQIERIRDVVGLAVGYNKARGDGIAVYSLDQLAGANLSLRHDTQLSSVADIGRAEEPGPAAVSRQDSKLPTGVLLAVGVLAAAGLAMMFLQGRVRRRKTVLNRLTDEERNTLLIQLNNWMEPQPPHAEQRK